MFGGGNYNPQGNTVGGISLQQAAPAFQVQNAVSGNVLQPTVNGGALNQGAYTMPDTQAQSQPQQQPQTPQYYYADGSSAGSNAAAVRAAADTAAYYNDQINNLNGQNGRLDSQLNTGLGNINNSYNQQSNRLNDQKGVAQRNYDTTVQQNMQGYANTRNGIMNNTRATSNALQRLLGLNGSGNSSAALEQAPYAAGLQGSQNLNGAQQNYSTNSTNLNNSWQDTQRQYSNAFSDLNSQKYQQENGLRSQIAQTRAGLLDQIAAANVNKGLAQGQSYTQAAAARTPYQDQINSLLDQITGLGNQYANPVMKTADVAFNTPTLGQFSLGQQAQIQNQTGGAGDINPAFYNVLGLNQQKDKNSNSVFGA